MRHRKRRKPEYTELVFVRLSPAQARAVDAAIGKSGLGDVSKFTRRALGELCWRFGVEMPGSW